MPILRQRGLCKCILAYEPPVRLRPGTYEEVATAGLFELYKSDAPEEQIKKFSYYESLEHSKYWI